MKTTTPFGMEEVQTFEEKQEVIPMTTNMKPAPADLTLEEIEHIIDCTVGVVIDNPDGEVLFEIPEDPEECYLFPEELLAKTVLLVTMDAGRLFITVVD